jgi:hypothetical protein
MTKAVVMAGLVPAIHVLLAERKDADARDIRRREATPSATAMRGHDGFSVRKFISPNSA